MAAESILLQSILILEEDIPSSKAISKALASANFNLILAHSLGDALSLLENNIFELILANPTNSELSEQDFLRGLLNQQISAPILLMSKKVNPAILVEAIKLGAVDFIQLPMTPTELDLELIQKVKAHIPDFNKPSSNVIRLASESTSMRSVIDLANKVSKFNTPVLLSGESGTGKEVLANYIHQQSKVSGSFVGINCASISKSLFESEFFGHEVGSFTGATQAKEGFFESAHNGTLFLDEISELSKPSQAKLLRAIQEGRNRRVGSTKSKDVNVRIISASNKCLDDLVKHKEFRDDLYYRIGVFTIEIPPLRQRVEDIIPMAKLFIKNQADALRIETPVLSKTASRYLQEYDWPGNVRELENTIERAIILSNGEIAQEHLQLGPKELDNTLANLNLALLADSAKRIAETKAILEALSQEGGNKAKSAEKLGVSYKTLLAKIKDYGLNA